MATPSNTSKNTNGSNGRAIVAGAAKRAALAAAVGMAAQAILNRKKGPRVLGVAVPDHKKMAKRATKAAEQLERVSDDVRVASAQAKRIAKALS